MVDEYNFDEAIARGGGTFWSPNAPMGSQDETVHLY